MLLPLFQSVITSTPWRGKYNQDQDVQRRELFLDIEFAEEALKNPAGLTVNIAHLAITNRAFERTPVSRLGNRAVSEVELQPYNLWKVDENHLVEDRSALQMLGLR